MSATKILTGAYGFACDEERRTGYFDIAVRSNLVVEIAPGSGAMRAKYPEAEVVDLSGKIILPTFFNSHFHPESLICRSLEPRSPVSQWRTEGLLNLEAALDAQDEDFYEKMYHLTFFSALQCGVGGMAFSVVGDETGARGMYSAVKLTGIDAVAFAESDQQITFLKRIVDRHLKAGLFVPYQKDLTLFGLSAVARNNSDSPGWIMTHADEDAEDMEITKSNFNSGIVQLLKKSKLLNASTILVGLNGTPAASLKAAKNNGVKVVLIPDTLTAATFKSIRNFFGDFAIGSNWETPGLFIQMKKLLELGCDPFRALESATRSGAALFNMGSRLGSLEAGKLASFAVVDARKLSARPLERMSPEDSARAFIEDYNDSDISDVMLDGEFVYRDKKILLYEDTELLKEGRELAGIVGKYVKAYPPLEEEKVTQMKAPQTRPDGLNEPEPETKKVELPKNIRKVFGEDEF